MWALPISLLFGFFGILSFVIAYQHRKRYNTEDIFINDIAIGLIFVMCAVLYPIMYINKGLAVQWQQTFYLISDIVIFLFIGILSYFVIVEFIRTRREPELKVTRGYEQFLKNREKEFKDNPEKKIKMDKNRKILHLIPVGVIWLTFLFAWVLGPMLTSAGIDPEGFGYFLIVLIGYGFCTMFMMAEMFRLTNYNKLFHLDPDWAHKWFMSSIKDSEVHSFISSIPIVLCLMPFVFGPLAVFIAVATVASLADAAASIFGKQFGKHRIPLNKDKTFVGLIAGGTVSFLSVMFTALVIPFPGIGMNFVKIMILSSGTAAVFMLIDIFAKSVGDNILNPLICGAAIVLLWQLMLLF
ncbi:MAG: hypothetical protein ACTSVI_12210 [Promethearchaeota archaeon]